MTAQHSVRSVSTPWSAVNQLMECLVLAFAYEKFRQRFIFVSDYPEKMPDSDRAFACFVFEGVTNFTRERGNLQRFRHFMHKYRSTDEDKPIVVQNIRSIEQVAKKAIELWFGPNFGGLSFEYDNVLGFTRDARVRQIGDSFVYYDLLSEQEFDFFKPFPAFDNTPEDRAE